MQHSFLRDHSMMTNIVDIGFESMNVSPLHPCGAVVLFDFEAAFSSISHDFTWRMLGCLGVQDSFLHAFRAFCHGNVHLLLLNG